MQIDLKFDCAGECGILFYLIVQIHLKFDCAGECGRRAGEDVEATLVPRNHAHLAVSFLTIE